MKRLALVAVIFLSLCPLVQADDARRAPTQTRAVTDAPKRVVSMSLCLDELLIALAEPAQIAAVSSLARDPRYSSVWQTAQQLTAHGGSAEQIASLQPDLILAADYERGKAVQVLRQLGFPVLAIDSPTRLADVPTMVRTVAAALGRPDQANQQLAALQNKLAEVHTRVATLPRLLALSYAPNGYTAGTGSIKNELLHLAGFDTVADRLQWPYDRELGIEQLLHLQPDVIFLEEQRGGQQSLAQQLLRHPALQAFGLQNSAHQSTEPTLVHTKLRRVEFPSQYWLCPGLQLGDAAQALTAARLAVEAAP
ncbi:ABC transporter substrate-binding protein [Permianibacter sp. IMCC34836]|uniref:ABC transporter substrate-binding protein n=1 Tax=Permianibacter fluminis TaxID=2738515 RepID=UPI00155550F9|nr:ABC transporter substrate-binding protein [Permianibacter fluminis]NQD38572.1 ABC transporter substrate-binding protein [Permianibacter fluminis]